jgi:hypothetical protein
MKANLLSFSLFLFLSSLLFSCDKEEFPDPTPDPNPSLDIYKDRFIAEAKSRGFNLDLSNVDIVYLEEDIVIGGESFCGYGFQQHPVTGKRTVFISKVSRCGWSTQSDLQRERFFFHEIGHAFLNLDHDDSFLCDGNPTSLMHSKVNLYDYYENDSDLKEYYLDELFDRLASEQKCIADLQDWEINPVFFKHQTEDDSWFFYNSNGSFSGERISQNSTNSLVISSVEGKTSTETGYWFTQISNPNIPKGAKVTVRTKVNSTGLKGPGVAIALRVYESRLFNDGAKTVESIFYSTEDNPVSGELTNQIIEVTLPSFTRKTEIIIPFAVILPATEGEVHFDDFEIIVEKQD